MRWMSIVSSLFVIALAGCGRVASDHPLSAPADSTLDERLVGIWEALPADPAEAKEPQHRLYVGRHATDAHALDVVHVDFDPEGRLDVRRYRAWGTRLGELLCLSVRGEGAAAYDIVRYQLADDGRLFLQTLHLKKVAAAVRAKQIAGIVPEDEKDEVRLTASTEELRAWLAGHPGMWIERKDDDPALRKLTID